MYFILTNGIKYCQIDKKNTCIRTSSEKLATKFPTQQAADAMLQKCSKKLKGYYSVPVDSLYIDEQITSQDKCRRRTFTSQERKIIYTKNKGRCAICGDFIPFDEFTVDHIIPLAKYGTNEIENLQCACEVCNRIKQDILPKELMDKLTQIVLYQMRKQYNDDFWRKINYLHKLNQKKKFRKIICIAKGGK